MTVVVVVAADVAVMTVAVEVVRSVDWDWVSLLDFFLLYVVEHFVQVVPCDDLQMLQKRKHFQLPLDVMQVGVAVAVKDRCRDFVAVTEEALGPGLLAFQVNQAEGFA